MSEKEIRTQLNSGELTSVRKWLKEAIENWLATSDATSFSPYQSFYRARMEPEELLFKIYTFLDEERYPDQSKTNQSLFRQALSELLTEPEIVERKPLVFEVLLKIGKRLGCAELIDALSINAHRGKLTTIQIIDPVSQQNVEIDLLRMSVSTVVEGGFASAAVTLFFKTLISKSGPDYPHFPAIFERLLESEPDKAITYALDYSNEIQDYLLHRMEYGDVEFVFAERKIKASFERFVTNRNFDNLSAGSLTTFAKSPVGWLLDADNLPPQRQTEARNIDPQSLKREMQASMKQRRMVMTKSKFRRKLETKRAGARSPRITETEVAAAKESAFSNG